MQRNMGGRKEVHVEPPVELESQFILRLPLEPSNCLRECLRTGSNGLKDRLSIKLENDMRHGMVYFDNWMLPAKVVDLPSMTETMKSIDNKSFYKTADVCQMLICKEEDDPTTDEEQPTKPKKKDPNKVEKKYLWPHGLTPPTKNVRKRRFRKTLKKKYTDAPEIEKEVKRLLRIDNDAVHVRWEVLHEENKDANGHGKEETIKEGEINMELKNQQRKLDVGEHDIFGEALSDSEEEESKINIMELEDNSRFSGDELSDSNVTSSIQSMPPRHLVTHFSQEMFQAKSIFERPNTTPLPLGRKDFTVFAVPSKSDQGELTVKIEDDYCKDEYQPFQMAQRMSKAEISLRMSTLQQQLRELRVQRQQQELEIANTDNVALQHRFQEILDNLIGQQIEKEQELSELVSTQ